MIDPNEFLPKGRSIRSAESKILKEHRKHQGVSELDAKHQYTKTARALPTYGVTFFLVKEKQKGKKKLVPRLLGINAEAILRLSEETKEVLQVWPLTQVKTYHAGKSETFTLNFGDYSDKEYSVKTNDAARIRDILQGYIDIIKRRMDARHRAFNTEHYAVMEDHVEASRGLTMEHVSHNSSKIVQETFVGPSKIVSYEPGQQVTQGTQIVTVQQIVVTGKGSNHQNVVRSEVPMRKDMSMDFVRKLNRLNSNSVKVVSHLAEPTDAGVVDARLLVESMRADMPSIEEGVNAAAQQQGSEEARRRLLEQLAELRDCMKALADATDTTLDPEKAEEAAKGIADLSTQMYFSLDPRTIKRGEFCRRSRKSFIQDEKMDATLRRASFIAASQTACGVIDDAKSALDKNYQGSDLDASEVEELEKAAEDKIGKLNAAIALYLTAYSDPQNIDYSAAVTSMNTINELLPELTKDAQRLSAVNDGKSREELLEQMRGLCDAAKMICLLNKPEDHDKIQEAVKDYGRASEKLLFTFKRMKKGGDDNNLQNEILDLARDVGDKTSLLLVKANELTSLAPEDPRSAELDHAGVRCADAAKDLLTCASLTAPSIAEPRCRSALSAAAEALGARAQALAPRWKPLVEAPARRALADGLRDGALDLAKALDRLKAAFVGLNGMPDDDDSEKAKEIRRLKFITTVNGARKKLDDAQDDLNKPFTGTPVQGASAEELKRRMAEKIAQLNAALAALVGATADRNKPDYATADLAVATITELMPEIVKDGKALSADQDEKARANMLADLKALCDATNDVCQSSENNSPEDLNNSAAKLAKTSGKLFYVFNLRADKDKENEILDVSSSACVKAGQMLTRVQQLAREAGGEASGELDAAGSRVADAANALLTAAQLTAPCMQDPRCQSTLMSAASALEHASQGLAAVYAPLVGDPRFQAAGHTIEGDRRDLQQELDRLKKACQLAENNGAAGAASAGQEGRRLKFVTTVGNAKKRLDEAEDELKKPHVGTAVTPVTEQAMADNLARLNAALAALVAASADRDKPDYATADQAVATVATLMPQIVEDGKALSANKDEKARAEMLADLKALCDAARDLCASSERGSIEDLNKSAVKFGNTSGKLVYVFNPRADQEKEHEIIDLSSSACKKASEMLAGVNQLAASVGGDSGDKLDAAGSKVADAANALLVSAQLTSPCIQDPRCQSSLVSTAAALDHASQQLASLWAPLVRDPRLQAAGRKLEADRLDLQKELDRLKKACQVAPSGVEVKHMDPVQERQRVQFVNTAVTAEANLQKAQKELNKPLVPSRPDQKPASMQSKLAQSLNQLNAAIATLLAATADRDDPNYDEAEQALHDINHLMPQVIKETKALSATKEGAERQALLDGLRATCDATRGICASLRDGKTQDAAKLAATAAKLTYVVSPQSREQIKVVELSASACQAASRVASDARRLADARPAARAWLGERGARAADVAGALMATTQLVGPCLHEPASQAAVLSAAEALQAAGEQLAAPPAAAAPADAQLSQHCKELAQALDALKAAVREEGGAKTPSRRTAPPPPARSVSNETAERLPAAAAPAGLRGTRDFNKEFLDRMRCEESHNAELASESQRKAEEEKAQKQQFTKAVDEASLKIQKAEEDVHKLFSTKDEVIPALSVDQTLVVQKQMEQKLALAGVAVADLVACNHADAMDLQTASNSTTTLADVVPHIVNDAKLLRGSMDENEKKSFLADVTGLFAATKNLLDTAKNDRKTLDKSAVEFGNRSAKLLYVVSTDVDPSQEKEVLEVVRDINESAGRAAVLGAAAAGALPAAGAERLCRAGGRCAEAASVLAYTAKLVAPSIQNANSHEALAQASTRLSDNLQAYADTWKPLEAAESGTVQQLRAEAASLESLLEGLRKDLGSGKLIKRRVVERVVVEDTPLRQLALIVLEGAKRKAESTSTSPELRVKYAKYANELSQAIKELDLANYRCRQASHDTEKRQNLEYAVQNLQVTLLQSRPTLDDRPQNNIVDLTDYVKDIASDADKLNKVCKDDLPETIRGHCEKISAKAAQVMSPSEQQALDGAFDDIQEVEQFAEECYKRVNAVNSVVEPLKDGKLKIDLQEAAIRLSEDCNMLRFATKSALATSQSVSLDATLEDLTDLEQRIDEMLVPGDGSSVPKKLSALGSGPSRLVAASSRACAGVAADLPPAFTAYMNDVRVCTDLNNAGDRQRSKAHLVKILHLLRALTMTTSRHVATWQKLGHPDTAEITGQIIEELESHKSHLDAASGKPQRSALSEVDMNKLLFPAVAPVQVDQKQVPAQALQAAAAKLSLCAGAVLQAAHAGALSRSAHAAARAAADLAGVACSLRTTDLAHNQKIDEATKEVSLQTYNVLRTADVFNQDPKNYTASRRLLDACRLLNDAINNLVRHTSDGGRLRRECGELTRALQLQQALAAALPASAMPYADCLDALHGQSEVLQKLNSDEPMSREEFSRTLGYASAAVCHSSEYAAQCAYLLQVAEVNKDLALEGFMDSSRITNLSEAVQDTCHRIIRTDVEQAKEEAVILDKQVQDLQQAVTEARDKTKDASVKEQLTTASAQVGDSAKVLHAVVHETCPNRAKITSWTIKLVDAVKSVDNIVESASLAPELKNVSTETMAKRDEILNHSRSLSSGMVSLLREVKAADDMDPMTWVTFGTSRKAILDAIDALVKSVKENGKRAGVLQKTESDLEEDDAPKKSYVQIQLDLANKWLRKPISKADVKNAGDDAAKNIIKLGEKMAEDLKDNEQEEVLQLVAECKALLADCYKKHDQEKAIALMERLKELRKTIERGVVTRVVEDFLEGEEPLADLDILADAEKDESKRKFLLERKLAELLAHLARVARTARLAAGAGSGGPQLAADLGRCSDQTELLAPMLVKAAQQRVASPDDQAAIEHYQKLLAQYAESLANVRSLCDQAVDPMEFVQTAGETMQRMREESNHQNDPQKCAYASMAITKLANRVINVSLSSTDVRRDPELQKALKEAKQRLKAAVPPPNARASKIPDWKDTTAEILRTTGEVESVLGGEIIFKKQQGADQPIFAAAFDLHTAVREWSARDNEIVAVAKRMAVLMAKLSDYMNTDRKRELLATTKSIVAESHEVASLATKLAYECTDVRIKTNLLQVCERIPTISGQLKMLATVKGSTLGNQGLKEDQEAMIMLVGNAQNLMLSVQEVVKAAASATVKIASQRGGARMRWVRRNYY